MQQNITQSPEFFYSINTFCHHASISRGLFYKLCKAGKGPKVFREPEGKKVFIAKEVEDKIPERIKENLRDVNSSLKSIFKDLIEEF
jgi:hypothetical protein